MTDESVKEPGLPIWENEAAEEERYALLRLAEELETARVELEARNEQLTEVSRQLEASRNEFLDLYESAPVAFVTLSPKGVITRANKIARDLLRLVSGPRIGTAFILYVATWERENFYREINRIAYSNRPRSFESRLNVQGRPPLTALFQVSPKTDFENRFREWHLAFFDVTEQKRLLDQLEKSRRDLALATDAGGIGIWNYDTLRRQSRWNEQLYRLLGLTPREGPESEDRFFDFIHPEDRRGVLRNIQAVIDGDDELDQEFRIVRADNGEVRWLASKGTLTRDAHGRVVSVQGVNFDITDRKRYEHALKESRRQFLSVLEHSLDIPFCRNVQKECYEYLSPAIERITGLSTEEILTLPDRELMARVHPEDQTRVSADLEEAYKAGSGKLAFRFRTKDGGYLWMSDHFSVQYDAAGRPLQRIGVMRDIADEKRAQALLKEQQQVLSRKLAELEHSNRELSEYGYAVSHDLKAPLRAVRNYADFLIEDLQGQLTGEQQQYLEGMKKALAQGDRLIRDLLDYSRIGKDPGPMERIDLTELVDEVSEFLHLTEKVSVSFRGGCATVTAERSMLTQIFSNLIGNAVKFNTSDVKKVEIWCRKVSSDRLELRVKDNGIGIGERYREKIFRVFQRLHSSTEYDGTGIGLAIVRKAAAQMGGTVRFESTPGQGSTFIVDLPETPPKPDKVEEQK